MNWLFVVKQTGPREGRSANRKLDLHQWCGVETVATMFA
jgi:hypothetical protein